MGPSRRECQSNGPSECIKKACNKKKRETKEQGNMWTQKSGVTKDRVGHGNKNVHIRGRRDERCEKKDHEQIEANEVASFCNIRVIVCLYLVHMYIRARPTLCGPYAHHYYTTVRFLYIWVLCIVYGEPPRPSVSIRATASVLHPSLTKAPYRPP